MLSLMLFVSLSTTATLTDSVILESAPIEQKIVLPEAKVDPTYCSCVTYLRSLGVPMPLTVDAIYYQSFPRGTPKVGGIIVMKYGDSIDQYHVALITSLNEGSVTVDEANYHHCEKDTRDIGFDDPHILFFWTPPTLSRL